MRDIHNIIKPLFDTLENRIYKDDKQIKHFEGYGLDMEFSDSYFEIELNLSREPALAQVLSETACFIVVKNDKRARSIAFEIKLLPLRASDKNSIKIEWLDSALLKYLTENTISDIDELATHVQYEHVELTIDAMRVTEDSAIANVRGTIDVELQYGSNSDLTNDIGFATSYSVPFEGELVVDLSSQTVNTAELRVDLSEWVEEADDE